MEGVLTEWIREDVELFVCVSTAAIYKWCLHHRDRDYDDILVKLLASMSTVAEHSISSRWQDCGSYATLEDSWLKQLHYLFNSSHSNYRAWETSNLFPHALVSALVQCRDAGLLTGWIYGLVTLIEESKRLLQSWETTSAGGGVLSSVSGLSVVHAEDSAVTHSRKESLPCSPPSARSSTPFVPLSIVEVAPPQNLAHRDQFKQLSLIADSPTGNISTSLSGGHKLAARSDPRNKHGLPAARPPSDPEVSHSLTATVGQI